MLFWFKKSGVELVVMFVVVVIELVVVVVVVVVDEYNTQLLQCLEREAQMDWLPDPSQL